MNNRPNTRYEETSVCLPCLSSNQQQIYQNPIKQTIPQNRDKKISLKRQRLSHQAPEYSYTPKVNIIQHTAPKTERFFMKPQSISIHYRSTQPQLQRLSITERNLNKPDHQLPETHKLSFQNKQKTKYQPNVFMLTSTTKLERSIPTSNSQLHKTRKAPVSIRKASTSMLYRKESVCSFTENHDMIERLQESQVLVDYFHPDEEKLYAMRSFQQNKSHINLRSLHSSFDE